jgi:competence protein ComGC
VATSPTLIWIIVTASIVAAMLVVAFAVFVARYLKQSQQRAAVYQTVIGHPSTSRVGSYALSTTSKKPSLSSLSSDGTESELQRRAIIQRSLEDRASRRWNIESDSGNVMVDWKEFEANLKQHPSLSLQHHPGLKRQPPYPGRGDLIPPTAPTPVADSLRLFPPSPDQISPPPAAVMGARCSGLRSHGRDNSYFPPVPRRKTSMASLERYGGFDGRMETAWI